MNLFEFILYKDKFKQKIIESQRIIELVTNIIGATSEDFDLSDDNVYDYPYVPDIQNEQKTFICLDTNVSKVSSNVINEFIISIWVFSTYKLQKLDSKFQRKGNLTDNLCFELDKIFNGYDDLAIGRFELLPTKTFSPSEGYTGKLVQYRCYDFNQNEGQY